MEACSDCLGFSHYPPEIKIAYNAIYGKIARSAMYGKENKMALDVKCTLCVHRMHIVNRCWMCMREGLTLRVCCVDLRDDQKCDDEIVDAHIRKINQDYPTYGGTIDGRRV